MHSIDRDSGREGEDEVVEPSEDVDSSSESVDREREDDDDDDTEMSDGTDWSMLKPCCSTRFGIWSCGWADLDRLVNGWAADWIEFCPGSG